MLTSVEMKKGAEDESILNYPEQLVLRETETVV